MISPLQKSNRLLQIFLGAFLLIAFRIWHLAVVQREEKLAEAQRPQRRTIIQQAERGGIVDCFGIPLATNRICYNASIYYSQFTQIPSVIWSTGPAGERVRTYARKDYIRNLARILSRELEMDSGRIEDLIHAKASLFPHVPFVMKSNISEQQYYRLRALEREWLGLHAAITVERTYPLGKTAASVIGHLGAISQKEYLQIAEEIDLLQQKIADEGEDEELLTRCQQLKEKAYTLNDLVGKAGIEKQYEQELRGLYGKKIFEVDRKGTCLRELPGSKEPIAGRTIRLSLSAELQQFCESLLIQNEKTRDRCSVGLDPQTKTRKVLKQPLIKGGAIVVLDPNNGEVLALAGAPRFDPNDFITTSHRDQKIPRIHRWLESDRYIANLWDGKDCLFREGIDHDEERPLTWDLYLLQTLALDSPLFIFWNRVEDIQTAIRMQEDFEALRYYANNSDPSVLIDLLFPDGRPCMQQASPAKESALASLQNHAHDAMPHWRRLESLLKEIPDNKDKLFALDMSRMAVYSPAFTDELIRQVGSTKLSSYRFLTQSFQRAEEEVRSQCQKIFHETEFFSWRGEHQKEFLHEKRKDEKEKKTYARPYIDYLDQKEREQFEELWQKIRLPLLASILRQNPSLLSEPLRHYLNLSLKREGDWTQLREASIHVSESQLMQWLKTMRSYRELERPLWGSYRLLRGKRGEQTERDLAAAFYPIGGFGFSRSHAFQSAAPMGSLFKLVTATAAMRQNSFATSPLVIFDEIRIDDKDRSPIVATSLEHKPFHRHYKGGRLPRSHLPNIGKVDLVGAIEQSSNPYFAILASDYLADPNDLLQTASDFGLGARTGIDLPGELKGRLPTDLQTNRTGLYSFAIGQHTLVSTPLQAARMLAAIANGGDLFTPRLMPPYESQDSNLSPSIRRLLCEGMDRVVWGPKGSARPSVIKGLNGHPGLLRDFLSLQHQMIGKTSTAEISCHPDCDPSSPSYIYKHIWFGAIAFPPIDAVKLHKERWEKPELIVIVYLRYGDGGKEAAPLAAQVIHKWREICKLH